MAKREFATRAMVGPNPEFGPSAFSGKDQMPNVKNSDAEKFRRLVWSTTLGVRAKLTLLALLETSEVSGRSLAFKAKKMRGLSYMVGRPLSSVVETIESLQKQKILIIEPSESTYKIQFFPENEVRRGEIRQGGSIGPQD